jgi:hypothetical protein
MAIQDEMYKLIEKEIDDTIKTGKEMRTVDLEKAKEVAKMLAGLATDPSESDNLISQYIVNIKNICS